MADKKNKLEVTLSLLDKATAPFLAFNKRIETMQAPLRNLSNRLSMFGRATGVGRLADQLGRVKGAAAGVVGQLGKLGGALGLAGGGAIFAFKRGFVDVAAEFEKFETVLGTIEGSSEKAKQAMGWISDFAAKTPYELTEVTDSFVKLRAYGMDPTKGLLKTLGDTSAAMGKPLMQAVEAVADAMTGENERLKEFGIRASKQGSKIVYEYSQNGKTIRAAAKAGNRAQIQATLEAIWNQKYAGAMDKLSGTWGGMLSNLSDQWTRFANMVMQSGPFEVLKGRLQELLSEIDRMADSGELQKLADEWGRKITDAFNKIYDAGVKIFNLMRRFVDAVGGVENAMMILAGVAAGPLLLSLLALTKAIAGIGLALLTTPLGWFLLAVAAIAGAAYLVYDNWESITAFFSEKWEGVKKTFSDASAAIEGVLSGMWERITGLFDRGVEKLKGALSSINPANWVGGAWDWTKEQFTFGQASPAGGSVMQGASYGEPVGVSSRAVEIAQNRMNGGATNTNNARVELDFKNVPRGVNVTPDSRNTAPLNLNMGYAMASPY
ncbi:TMP repeat [Bordetella phage PY223]